MSITLREFRDLLVIIDAKITLALAKDSSDGGLVETIRSGKLIKEFEERMNIHDRIG